MRSLRPSGNGRGSASKGSETSRRYQQRSVILFYCISCKFCYSVPVERESQPSEPLNLEAIREASVSEASAVEFLERSRWGDTPACPRCGSIDVYRMLDRATGERNKDYRWRCRACKRMYTVRTNTIMEESRLPLRVWVHVIWRTCASKKGVSALQIKRECEISYTTALYLMKRVREVMKIDHQTPPKLSGTVEVDEAWIGGNPRHRMRSHTDPITGETRKYLSRDKVERAKTPIIALVQRGGKVRVRHIDRVHRGTLGAAIRELVEQGSTIYTDENRSYSHLDRSTKYRHETVTHSAGEYVRGDVTTNTVEGFFSLVKRGVYGTFHSVSKQHLHRYLAEFEFRYNTRKMDDGERVAVALNQIEGKRLTYADSLVSKPKPATY